MSLNPRQFGEQLQMLMKPSEMRAASLAFGDQLSHETTEDLMAIKLDQADRPAAGPTHSTSHTEHIRREGVRDPVKVYKPHLTAQPMLVDGHHRFAVQDRREQQGEEVYLPVSTDDGSGYPKKARQMIEQVYRTGPLGLADRDRSDPSPPGSL